MRIRKIEIREKQTKASAAETEESLLSDMLNKLVICSLLTNSHIIYNLYFSQYCQYFFKKEQIAQNKLNQNSG